MPLNNQQKAAVEYLDGPLLVLAGPGTGKTQLLSHRVAHILETTDASPDNILCLTFTDAAAANMRARLTTLIGPDANKINIFTYHSFGTFLLSTYQNFNPNLPRFFENSTSDLQTFRIIEDLKANLDFYDALKKQDTSDLISTISSVKSARLTPEDLESIYQNNEAEIIKINTTVAPILDQIIPHMKFDKALPLYQSALEQLDSIAKSTPTIKNIPALSTVLFNALHTAFANLDPNKPKLTPLSNWRTSFFDKNAENRYSLHIKTAENKLKSLYLLIIAYKDYLVKHNLFDFSDMIEEAIHALGTDISFKNTISERFQYIMLDEFQDTNPAQFELVKLLTDYEKPQVMAVGDDDQAIFEFQGASASNFQIFHDHYNSHIITLTENYRSTKEILALSSEIASQISDRFSTQNHFEKNLTSFISSYQKPNTIITRQEFLSSDAEYFWVAEKVNELINSGENPGEIAIIAPKHRFIAPILPYFQKFKNIPLSYERRDNLFLDPTINGIIILSNFAASITENRPLENHILEILSIPALKISSKTALLTADLIRTLGKLKSSAATKLNPAISQLNITHNLSLAVDQLKSENLLSSSEIAPLESFVKLAEETAANYHSLSLVDFLNLLLPTFFDFYTDAGKNKTQAFTFYENLITLTEQIKSYAPKDEIPTAKHLINFAKDCAAANQSLINSSPYKNSANSVQLLSVHKSKGLEFKHVFLISLDDTSWGSAKGNNNTLTLPPNLKQIRHTGSSDDELIRLFFVAITRARTHLYMTNSSSNFAGKSLSRLKYLKEFENPDHRNQVDSPLVPEKIVVLHNNQISPETDLAARWSNQYNLDQPSIKDLLTHRLQNFQLSPSSFISFFDITYSGPQVFYEQYLLPNFKTAPTEDQLYGTLIHKTLDYAVKNNIFTPEPLINFYNTELSNYFIDEPTKMALKFKGDTSLTIILQSYKNLYTDQNTKILSEVNLTPAKITLDGVPITGTLDLIRINELDKTIEIFDYKTGKFKDKNWTSEPSLLKYQQQLIFYKIILNLSPTFSKYTVTAGHLLFITPDEELKIHQKTYEYTEKDESDTKNLIKKIYQLVSSLTFLDHSELMIVPNKTASASDVKKFIKKILDIS